MKKLMYAFLCTAAFASCEKETAQPDNNNNGGGNNNNGFTPPTESYWRINGESNSGSADAVQVNMTGCSMNLSKPFTALGFNYCQLRVFFNGTGTSNEPDIRNAVPEGGYKEYYITTGTSGNDSVRVELDVEDMNSATSGHYFYRATSGKVYISKKDGKLRYTADGTLPMSGVKYPNMQQYQYNCSLEFSQAQN